MLVVRRKVAESLVIGDGIYVEILEIGHGQVKIGITAPRDIPVVRSEIRITKDQNQQSAGLSAIALDHLIEQLRPRVR